MRSVRIAVLASILGAFPATAQAPDASSPPSKLDVKTLMQIALAEEFTPGREVLVDLVEVPPNTALEPHWHPGEEFHYYLEGEVTVQIDGEPPILGTPGKVGHVPFKKRHTAVAGDKGAKVLVFRVHAQGEPTRYLDKEASGGR